MSSSPSSAQLDPGIIFDTLNAYQRSFALKAAIELKIFTRIAEGASSAAAIGEKCGTAARGARILCDYLKVIGFLAKSDETYGLTPESGAFLNEHSPAYLGAMAGFIAADDHVANYQNLAAVVRNGGAIGEGNMAPEHPLWVDFAHSMAPLMAPAAAAVAEHVASVMGTGAEKIKVLDIAASHGLFGIAIARLNPLAEIVALDWKNVLQVGIANAKAAGIETRFRTIAGSAFDADLGSDYDVVLIPNFLHHFSPAVNVTLLKRIRAAMKPAGVMATLEFVPNDDRVSPPAAASFSLMMLGSTAEGDAYTFAEFDRMFREAGFDESRMIALDPLPEALIVTRA